MTQLSESFNVLLCPADRTALDQLAAKSHSSCGARIRALIRTAWFHECEGRPHCPDGQRCMCPHLLADAVPRTPNPAPTGPRDDA